MNELDRMNKKKVIDMWKKFSAVLLVGTLIMGGCSNVEECNPTMDSPSCNVDEKKKEDKPNETNVPLDSVETKSSGPIEVKHNKEYLTLIKRDTEEAKEDLLEQWNDVDSIKDAKIEEDGSIVATIDEGAYLNTLDSYKESIDAVIDETLSLDLYSFVENIEYSDDLASYTITVTNSDYDTVLMEQIIDRLAYRSCVYLELSNTYKDGMSFKIENVDGSELSNQVITYDDMVKYLYGE